jgi:hypothetical protein
MTQYDSAAVYIESFSDTTSRIKAIDSIIEALLLTAAKAASGDHIFEYTLDNGQTIIKSTYKGADGVYKSIQAFEKLKQMYINRLNGRVVRLVDSKNINGYGSFR